MIRAQFRIPVVPMQNVQFVCLIQFVPAHLDLVEFLEMGSQIPPMGVCEPHKNVQRVY